MDTKYSLINNSIGFFEVTPKPTVAELEKHYTEKYYQRNLSTYKKTYSPSELQYFEVEAQLCLATLDKYASVDTSLLDIGCGEGFFARYFFEKHWNVTCVDFSSDGIERHNKVLLDCFDQSDIFTYLDNKQTSGITYGLLNLDNVLEHVLWPVELLASMTKLMTKDTIARIEVPNDFSSFQSLLVDLGCTDETWISPPEHLSYFNKDSLVSLLENVGLEVVSLQADYPIEHFLLNDNTNYWKNRDLGKSAHFARVTCTNYLANNNLERYLDYREASADLEFGRSLTAYTKLA
jgi:2-polyprenyl-3-methyl-5-hydroxy-6-metoxy-1,4-benzoquinol methylase